MLRQLVICALSALLLVQHAFAEGAAPTLPVNSTGSSNSTANLVHMVPTEAGEFYRGRVQAAEQAGLRKSSPLVRKMGHTSVRDQLAAFKQEAADRGIFMAHSQAAKEKGVVVLPSGVSAALASARGSTPPAQARSLV